MVGVFFDSAERHDSQRPAGTRVGKSAWVANILSDANSNGDNVVHGDVRGVSRLAGNRARIFAVAGDNDSWGVVSAYFGEQIFIKKAT